MRKILTTLLLSLSCQWLQAGDISLGTPGYGGTGCPAGSASATLSPDQKSLSIIFDQYVVEANRRSRIGRKTCNIAIPVNVPNGYSISIFKVDYRGFVAVPAGATARFNVEYFFAGQQGPAYQKTWNGAYTSDYFLTNTLGMGAMVWSACGAQVNLRVNSGMFVQTNGAGQDSMATVDSADVNAGLIYHFQIRRC